MLFDVRHPVLIQQKQRKEWFGRPLPVKESKLSCDEGRSWSLFEKMRLDCNIIYYQALMNCTRSRMIFREDARWIFLHVRSLWMIEIWKIVLEKKIDKFIYLFEISTSIIVVIFEIRWIDDSHDIHNDVRIPWQKIFTVFCRRAADIWLSGPSTPSACWEFLRFLYTSTKYQPRFRMMSIHFIWTHFINDGMVTCKRLCVKASCYYFFS